MRFFRLCLTTLALLLIGGSAGARPHTVFDEQALSLPEASAQTNGALGKMGALKVRGLTLSLVRAPSVDEKDRLPLPRGSESVSPASPLGWMYRQALNLRMAFAASPKAAAGMIREIAAQGPGGYVMLSRMLYAESEGGGIPDSESGLRDLVWRTMEALAFGRGASLQPTQNNRPPLPKDRVQRAALGHLLISGTLPARGALVAGELWGQFTTLGGEPYLLEMRDGWPERLWFPQKHRLVPFFSIFEEIDEAGTRRKVGVHRGMLSRQALQRMHRRWVESELDKYANLSLGGGPGDEEGRPPKGKAAWFRTDETLHAGERCESWIEFGLVTRTRFLETARPPLRSPLVWNSRLLRYTTTLHTNVRERMFNHLQSHHQVDRMHLHAVARNLAGRSWFRIPTQNMDKILRIFEIRNPTHDNAFIVGVSQAVNGRILWRQRARVLYERAAGSAPGEFVKGALREVFTKWSPVLVATVGQALADDHIEERTLTKQAALELDGQMVHFGRFPGARVEVDHVNGKAVYVKFLYTKDRMPILSGGKPVVFYLNGHRSAERPWPAIDDLAWMIPLVQWRQRDIPALMRHLYAVEQDAARNTHRRLVPAKSWISRSYDHLRILEQRIVRGPFAPSVHRMLKIVEGKDRQTPQQVRDILHALHDELEQMAKISDDLLAIRVQPHPYPRDSKYGNALLKAT